MIGKIYAGILVDRFHRVTDGFIDEEQGVFRSIFTQEMRGVYRFYGSGDDV